MQGPCPRVMESWQHSAALWRVLDLSTTVNSLTALTGAEGEAGVARGLVAE